MQLPRLFNKMKLCYLSLLCWPLICGASDDSAKAKSVSHPKGRVRIARTAIPSEPASPSDPREGFSVNYTLIAADSLADCGTSQLTNDYPVRVQYREISRQRHSGRSRRSGRTRTAVGEWMDSPYTPVQFMSG